MSARIRGRSLAVLGMTNKCIFVHNPYSRPFVGRKIHPKITFVVAPLDVVSGFIFFNELVFQDQRFFGVGGDNKVDVGNIFHQIALKSTAVFNEVGLYAIPQIYCFSDIQKMPAGILEQVRAGFLGEGFDSCGQFFVHPY